MRQRFFQKQVLKPSKALSKADPETILRCGNIFAGSGPFFTTPRSEVVKTFYLQWFHCKFPWFDSDGTAMLHCNRTDQAKPIAVPLTGNNGFACRQMIPTTGSPVGNPYWYRCARRKERARIGNWVRIPSGPAAVRTERFPERRFPLGEMPFSHWANEWCDAA